MPGRKAPQREQMPLLAFSLPECARECARLAVETRDREEKHHLLEMAQAWTELALFEAGVISGISQGRPPV
jgi:hypothetical protein